MEQPREFDPFMCMWSGGWARLGALGRGPSQGAGLEYSLVRPICQGRDSLELPWDKDSQPPTPGLGVSASGQECPRQGLWKQCLQKDMFGQYPHGDSTLWGQSEQ